MFPNLKDLNLSENNMQSLKGIGNLSKLQRLRILKNKLDTLYVKNSPRSPAEQDSHLKKNNCARGLNGLRDLEILDVSYNNLKDLYGL